MTSTRIGRYEIERELGHGAMAVVYKAVDPLIGRTVAIKTIRLEPSVGLERNELRQRLYREAQSAGKLNHPNIVTIYDIGEEGDVTYIAMEFIEGESLEVWKAGHTIPPLEQTISIAEQVAAGLDFAAARGIIHRDIKPGNILLTHDLRVKIADFGIAKIQTSKFTQTGLVMGTPSYMSPEQAMGKDLDGRSDLFSLGIIFYEMLTGEKPFSGTNPSTIIYKILHEEPVSPRHLNVTLHPGFDLIVRKMLAKDPEQRYQSCGALLEDLANYRSLDRPAQLESQKTLAEIPARHNRLVPILSLFLLATIVVLGYTLYRQMQPAAPQPIFVPQPAQESKAPSPKTQESPQKAPPQDVAITKKDASAPAKETDPAEPSIGRQGTGERESKKDQIPQKNVQTEAKPSFARIQLVSDGADYSVDLYDGTRRLKAEVKAPAQIQVPAGEHTFQITNPSVLLNLRVEKKLAPDQVLTVTIPGLGSAYIEVPNDAYNGCEILMDGTSVPSPYPAQIPKLAAAKHQVTFRWSAGKYSGKEFSSDISIQADHHYLVTGNPQTEKVIIQLVR